MLKAGIKAEYDAMRAGGSHLYKLLDEAEGLITMALAACPPDPSPAVTRPYLAPQVKTSLLSRGGSGASQTSSAPVA